MEQLKYLIERLENIDEKFSEKLEHILVQTTRTNGRVTSMEKIVEEQGKDIESAKRTIGFNKGRDYVVIALFGLFGGFFVSYMIGGGREREIERAIEKYKIENHIK